MRDKIMRPIVLGSSLVLLLFGGFVPSVDRAYAMFGTSVVGYASYGVAPWSIDVKINNSNDLNIDLKDTIIENNYNNLKVVPGSKGVIPVLLDFSGSDVEAYYTIKVGEDSELPSNIKFYSDSNFTQELSASNLSSNYVTIDNNIDPIELLIYWQWVFTDDDESLWADKEITLDLVIEATQAMHEGA